MHVICNIMPDDPRASTPDQPDQHPRAAAGHDGDLTEGLAADVLRAFGLATPQAPHDAPTALGTYDVVGMLGFGGMGTVYEARHRSLGHRVAIKVLRQGLVGSSARRRFRFEAQTLARLRHPHIATFHEASIQDVGGQGVPFVVMEFIPNARTCIEYAQERQLGLRDRLRLFRSVCDAVDHGHQRGIIHRDLSPKNILVDNDGNAKVIDFGLARAIDPEQSFVTQDTRHGSPIGTLQYMSPEQCLADHSDLDTRTDVYSLGMVLYELLWERPAYQTRGLDIVNAVQVIRDNMPLRPRSFEPDAPADLQAIVLKAIEKERDRRYRSAAELSDDLQRFLDDEPITARPPDTTYLIRRFVRQHRALAGAIGVSMVSVLLVAIAMIVTIAILAHSSADQRAMRAKADATAIEMSEQAAENATLAAELRTALDQAEALTLAAQQSEVRAQKDAIAAVDASDEADRQKQLAAEIAQRLDRVAGFFSDDLIAHITGDPDNPGMADLRRVYDVAAENIPRRFPDDPGTQAELRRIIARGYWRLALFPEAELQMDLAIDAADRSGAFDMARDLKQELAGWLEQQVLMLAAVESQPPAETTTGQLVPESPTDASEGLPTSAPTEPTNPVLASAEPAPVRDVDGAAPVDSAPAAPRPEALADSGHEHSSIEAAIDRAEFESIQNIAVDSDGMLDREIAEALAKRRQLGETPEAVQASFQQLVERAERLWLAGEEDQAVEQILTFVESTNPGPFVKPMLPTALVGVAYSLARDGRLEVALACGRAAEYLVQSGVTSGITPSALVAKAGYAVLLWAADDRTTALRLGGEALETSTHNFGGVTFNRKTRGIAIGNAVAHASAGNWDIATSMLESVQANDLVELIFMSMSTQQAMSLQSLAYWSWGRDDLAFEAAAAAHELGRRLFPGDRVAIDRIGARHGLLRLMIDEEDRLARTLLRDASRSLSASDVLDEAIFMVAHSTMHAGRAHEKLHETAHILEVVREEVGEVDGPQAGAWLSMVAADALDRGDPQTVADVFAFVLAHPETKPRVWRALSNEDMHRVHVKMLTAAGNFDGAIDALSAIDTGPPLDLRNHLLVDSWIAYCHDAAGRTGTAVALLSLAIATAESDGVTPQWQIDLMHRDLGILQAANGVFDGVLDIDFDIVDDTSSPFTIEMVIWAQAAARMDLDDGARALYFIELIERLASEQERPDEHDAVWRHRVSDLRSRIDLALGFVTDSPE